MAGTQLIIIGVERSEHQDPYIHSSEMFVQGVIRPAAMCKKHADPQGLLDPEPFDPDKGGPFISTKFVTSWYCCEYYTVSEHAKQT